MTIYLDSDNICHLEDGGGMRAVETDAFDGKCREFIEGYRYISEGETWTRSDGEVFHGEMLIPVKPYVVLIEVQAQYEREQLAAVTADRDKCLADMQELIDEVLGG